MLNERQKAVAKTRILTDSSVVVDERLNIRDSFKPFADPMYWYDIIHLYLYPKTTNTPIQALGNDQSIIWGASCQRQQFLAPDSCKPWLFHHSHEFTDSGSKHRWNRCLTAAYLFF